MKKKGIIVSGYFNPIHKGHIEYFHSAKRKGDVLIVIVNNDIQRKLKGSSEFMDQEERILIVKELRITDYAYVSIDNDRTVSLTIKKIFDDFGSELQLYFANGGDQDNLSVPEKEICNKLGVTMIDGLGDKIQSSSWLLKKSK
jgi:cytidyltransferase-like protein